MKQERTQKCCSQKQNPYPLETKDTNLFVTYVLTFTCFHSISFFSISAPGSQSYSSTLANPCYLVLALTHIYINQKSTKEQTTFQVKSNIHINILETRGHEILVHYVWKHLICQLQMNWAAGDLLCYFFPSVSVNVFERRISLAWGCSAALMALISTDQQLLWLCCFADSPAHQGLITVV